MSVFKSFDTLSYGEDRSLTIFIELLFATIKLYLLTENYYLIKY